MCLRLTTRIVAQNFLPILANLQERVTQLISLFLGSSGGTHYAFDDCSFTIIAKHFQYAGNDVLFCLKRF